MEKQSFILDCIVVKKCIAKPKFIDVVKQGALLLYVYEFFSRLLNILKKFVKQ